ncbi:dethiobiotin synthase [Anthocerotibacter panamensis]|uniref:dethiobiotin synthase n=1 Tax=Anthocerotibacter panamensis TaxID=2857077 RepID=UPI001C406970|nr:dethiobiotin synthase [Anthocerotibacter panamensis]
MRTLLITGTDTGVGKTALALGLTAYWQYYRSESVGLMKLLACGPDDVATYRRILTLDQELFCPLTYDAPLAPPLAAEKEGAAVELSQIWQGYQRLSTQKEQIFLEGVGGLGCPLTRDYTVADLARDWRVPVLLVAPVRLGVIGQLVAHSVFARHYGLKTVGIVLNQPEPVTPEDCERWAPVDLIANLCRLPVLGCFPYLPAWNALALAEATAGLDLEYLL